MSFFNNMKTLRKRIDKLDNKIIKILAKRMDVVTKIKEYKEKHNLPILDKKREVEMREFRQKLAKKYNLKSSFLESLFQKILLESKKKQKKT
jgi:chorismate mutase